MPRKGSYFKFPDEFRAKITRFSQELGKTRTQVLIDLANAGLAASAAAPATSKEVTDAITGIVAFFSECLEQPKWGEKFSDFAETKDAANVIGVLEKLTAEANK